MCVVTLPQFVQAEEKKEEARYKNIFEIIQINLHFNGRLTLFNVYLISNTQLEMVFFRPAELKRE